MTMTRLLERELVCWVALRRRVGAGSVHAECCSPMALRPRGEGILDLTATCMRDGSLKDRGVTIIGRTDPSGGNEYNQELGMERASAARDYLTGRGVASSSLMVKFARRRERNRHRIELLQLDRRVEIAESAAMAR